MSIQSCQLLVRRVHSGDYPVEPVYQQSETGTLHGILTSTPFNYGFLFHSPGSCGIAVAVLSYFVLPDSPLETRWLTPEERQLAHNRIDASVTTKGKHAHSGGSKAGRRGSHGVEFSPRSSTHQPSTRRSATSSSARPIASPASPPCWSRGVRGASRSAPGTPSARWWQWRASSWQRRWKARRAGTRA